VLDHVTIGVGDVERAKRFYDAALKPLGITRLYAEGDRYAGYGAGQKAFFWIGVKPAGITGVHVAFAAADRATVDRFYAAALAAGGRDNGAFVLDPDGHRIEAVCHAAP